MAPLNPQGLHIAVVYEEKSEYLALGYSVEYCCDLPHDGEVAAVCASMEEMGHRVTAVPGMRSLVRHLAEHEGADWDLVFNLAEGFAGCARGAQVPCLLEAYEIPYTFADAEAMALCFDKARTKIVLDSYGIPTAPFVAVAGHESDIDWDKIGQKLPKFPLFVKPNSEGSRKGIDSRSRVSNRAELESAVERLRTQLPGRDILIEPFLSGRELSVSIVGTGSESRVIGVVEFLWNRTGTMTIGHADSPVSYAQEKISAFIDEGGDSSPIECFVVDHRTDKQAREAGEVALSAWKALRCRDAGRVDTRFDSDAEGGVANVLELNPIAGLCPGVSYLPQTAKYNGMSFQQVMRETVESALSRGIRARDGTRRALGLGQTPVKAK